MLECIFWYSPPIWHCAYSKSTKWGIKCGKKCTSFIKFNMVVSLAEVYKGKHFSLWKLVKYIIRGSIVEWFSGYGFVEAGRVQVNAYLGCARLVKLFLLTMTKQLIHGVAWSTSLMMSAACISGICCLKVTCWCTDTGLNWHFLILKLV